MTFDKFAWLKAIYAETKPSPGSKKGFTDGEKAVLAYIAVFKVLTGNDTFSIRQSTLAEQCGTSRKTVNSAIGRATRLKYLTMSERHKPAPGRKTPAEWRLLIPEPCNKSGHGWEANHVTENVEPCNKSGHGWPNHVTENVEPCNRTNSPTSENNAPYSTKEQFSKRNSSRGVGVAAATAAITPIADLVVTNQTNVPPQGYPWCCPQHPYGTKNNRACMACNVRRLQFQQTPAWFELVREASTVTKMAEREGKKDAPITALALRAGRDPDEVKATVQKLVAKSGSPYSPLPTPPVRVKALDAEIVPESEPEHTLHLVGSGRLTTRAFPIRKSPEEIRQEQIAALVAAYSDDFGGTA